jgi:hypothetical protein
MLEWFISVNNLLQQMKKKATDAAAHLAAGQEDMAKSVQEYLKADYQRLCELWTAKGLSRSLCVPRLGQVPPSMSQAK